MTTMSWFVRGDIDGFFGLALDNLVQLLLIVPRHFPGPHTQQFITSLYRLHHPRHRPVVNG